MMFARGKASYHLGRLDRLPPDLTTLSCLCPRSPLRVFAGLLILELTELGPHFALTAFCSLFMLYALHI
jgi:hypothetical protein